MGEPTEEMGMLVVLQETNDLHAACGDGRVNGATLQKQVGHTLESAPNHQVGRSDFVTDEKSTECEMIIQGIQRRRYLGEGSYGGQ